MASSWALQNHPPAPAWHGDEAWEAASGWGMGFTSLNRRQQLHPAYSAPNNINVVPMAWWTRSRYRDPRTVRCSCGARLALAGSLGNGDVELVALGWSRCRWGHPVIAATWLRIVCRKCRLSWEGRRDQLECAYRAAVGAGARSVSVPERSGSAPGEDEKRIFPHAA